MNSVQLDKLLNAYLYCGYNQLCKECLQVVVETKRGRSEEDMERIALAMANSVMRHPTALELKPLCAPGSEQ